MESFQKLWKYKIWRIKTCQEKNHINSENWHFSFSLRSYLLHTAPTISSHWKPFSITRLDVYFLLPHRLTLIFTQFPSLHPIKPRLSCPCFSSIQSFWIQCSPHPTLTEIRSEFQCSFTTKSTIKSALNCSQTKELLSLPGPSSPLLSQQASHSTHHIQWLLQAFVLSYHYS